MGLTMPALDNISVGVDQLPTARNTVQVNPADFGEAQAQGIGAVGQDLQKATEFEKQKMDTLAVTDASNQLDDVKNKMFFDPQTGLFNMRGKDALKVPQLYQDQESQAVNDIAGKLSDPSQRIAFMQMAMQGRAYDQRMIGRHVSGEMQQFDDQTTQASIKNSQDLATASGGDPVVIGGAIDRQRNVIEAQAVRMGWDPQTTQYMLNKAASDTHMGVIDGMLTAGNYTQAQTYFDHVKGDIDGQDQVVIQKALKEGTLRAQTITQANDIMSANPNDIAAQVKAAQKIQDPTLQESVLQHINMMDDLQKKSQEDLHTNALNQANDTISKGGTISQIPPQVWTTLKPEEQQALMKIQNFNASGGDRPMNWKAWTDINQLTPQQLANTDIYSKYYGSLDNEHYNKLVEMQNQATNAVGGKQSTITHLQTANQMFDSTVFPVAFPDQKSPSSLTGDDKVRYGQLLSQVQSQINQQESEGKKLTPDQMQAVMDKFTHQQVFVHHWYGDKQVPLASITKDDDGNAYVPMAQIPDAAHNKILNYAQSLGVKATDDQVERAYAAAMMGNDALVQQILAGK